MQAQVIDRVGMFAIAATVGVRGCGLRATYVRNPQIGNWILNGAVEQPVPAQRPPAPPPADYEEN
ncbi:MAG: hypothetical protein EXR72_17360 [Myxococcales bacterium]|nr:hypothetical protein [Myxococcales bacterium]